MAVYRIADAVPRIAADVWIAENATVLGDVVLEEGVSIWYAAVLRGDNDRIHLGRGSNVQDGCVLHADEGVPLRVGEGVIVGHQAMLHGCSVGDGTLIGIRAVVLNRARIGRNCIVGAGAVVTEDKEFPDGSLIVGAPARLARMLGAQQIASLARMAEHYEVQARRHRSERTRIDRPQ